MKKILVSILITFVSLNLFSLPNMKLSYSGETFFTINDNNLYNPDGELAFSNINGTLYYPSGENSNQTISETDEIIEIIDTENGILRFSKKNGNLIYRESKYDLEKYIEYFDEESGNKLTEEKYFLDLLESVVTHVYEKGLKTKIIEKDAKGNYLSSILVQYDKKTKKVQKAIKYSKDNKIEFIVLFDKETETVIEISEYDENGLIKNKIKYDKNTGYKTEKEVYLPNEKTPTNHKYIQFENGTYFINYREFLRNNFVKYDSLEKMAQESKENPIEWNRFYFVKVTKYDYSEKDGDYHNLKELMDNYLFEMPVTLTGSNFDKVYSFNITEDEKLDLSSCYLLEFIKKPVDYKAMNKSGKGTGPFGLDIAMTLEEITDACNGKQPEYISDNRYDVVPKKSHPLFNRYIAWVSDKYGLYYIKGISKDIYTTGYGTEIKSEFNNVISIFEKKYGKFTIHDIIKDKDDYYVKNDEYWMSSIRKGVRDYYATWYPEYDKKDKFDGLKWIGIGIEYLSYDKGYIWIEYEFENSTEAKAEQDDVF